MAQDRVSTFNLVTTVPTLTQSGARWQYKLPEGYNYILRSIVATITTSATVGNRNFYFQVNALASGTTSGKYFVYTDTAPVLNVAASSSGICSLSFSAGNASPATYIDGMASTHMQVILPELVIPGGSYLVFMDKNAVDVGGDTFAINRYIVEEIRQ